MAAQAQPVVQTFFVTLKRSFIGKPWFHKRTLESLGLRRRMQCVEKPNNACIRGELQKVRPAPPALPAPPAPCPPQRRHKRRPATATKVESLCGHSASWRAGWPAGAAGVQRPRPAHGCAVRGPLRARRRGSEAARHARLQVAHLVRVETDQMYYHRKLAERQAAQLQPPLIVRHAMPAQLAGAPPASASSSSRGSTPADGR